MQKANSPFFIGLRQSDDDPRDQLIGILEGMLLLLTQDGGDHLIPYRPSFKRITGSTNCAILLQQIWHHFKNKQYHAFYKFLEPCKSPLYREGDSWSEELAFSAEEVRNALNKIGKKITSDYPRHKAYEEGIVVYWTDKNHVTWYDMNLVNFMKAVVENNAEIINAKPSLLVYIHKLTSLVYQINQDSRFIYQTDNDGLYSTTETTIEISEIPSDPPAVGSAGSFKTSLVPPEESDSKLGKDEEQENPTPPTPSPLRTQAPQEFVQEQTGGGGLMFPKPPKKEKKTKYGFGSRPKTRDNDEDAPTRRSSALPAIRTPSIPPKTNVPPVLEEISPFEKWFRGVTGKSKIADEALARKNDIAGFEEGLADARWKEWAEDVIADTNKAARDKYGYPAKDTTLFDRLNDTGNYRRWRNERYPDAAAVVKPLAHGADWQREIDRAWLADMGFNIDELDQETIEKMRSTR